MDGQAISKLEEIVRAYPWFAQAHALLALAQKRAGSSHYQNTLHKAALSAPDRQAIYYLLEKDVANTSTISSEPLPEIIPIEPIIISEEKIEIDTTNWVDIILDELPVAVQEEEWIDIPLTTSAVIAPVQDSAPEEIQVQPEEPIAEKEPLPPSVDFAELGELGQDIINKAISSSIELEVSEKDESIATKAPAAAPDYEDDFLNFIAHSIGELADPTPASTGWSEPAITPSPTQSVDPIIERFIQTEPQINRGKAIEYSAGNMAKESLEEDVNLVTETMAKLYVKQGKLDKARKAYKKLIELYPEKSVYFATQLKNLNKKN
jgi:tetratricopeptide (TPR) repeat protein